MGLGGTPTDCHNGNITTGGLDYNKDGTVDHWFNSASGNLNICGNTLRVTNLVLDGQAEEGVVATYVGTLSAYTSSEILLELVLEDMLEELSEGL